MLGGGLEKGACASLLANGDGAMLGLSPPGLPPGFCTDMSFIIIVLMPFFDQACTVMYNTEILSDLIFTACMKSLLYTEP